MNENEVTAERKATEKQRRWSQRVVAERRNDPVEQAAKKDELYHSNLEQYEYLVSQHYIDPDNSCIKTIFF